MTQVIDSKGYFNTQEALGSARARRGFKEGKSQYTAKNTREGCFRRE